MHVECKRSETSNNRGNWNYLRIIQQIPEQLIGRTRNQGTTEDSHTGDCTHISESSTVKVQIGNSIRHSCYHNCNHERDATFYILNTRSVFGK